MTFRRIVLGAALAATTIGMAQTASADAVVPAAFDSAQVHAFFSSTGPIKQVGGSTWTYTGLTPSDFQSMWWGPTTVAMGLNGVANPLAFSSFSGNTAIWTGLSQIQVSNGFGYITQNVDTELVMTLQSPSGAVFSANPAGTTNGADYQVTGSSFSVSLQFLTRFSGSGSFVDAKTFYDGQSTNPNITGFQTSFGASFFIEPKTAESATPLPTAALGGMVLLGGAVTRRSRRISAK